MTLVLVVFLFFRITLIEIGGVANTFIGNDALHIAHACVKLISVNKLKSLIEDMEMLARKQATVEHGICFLRTARKDPQISPKYEGSNGLLKNASARLPKDILGLQLGRTCYLGSFGWATRSHFDPSEKK